LQELLQLLHGRAFKIEQHDDGFQSPIIQRRAHHRLLEERGFLVADTFHLSQNQALGQLNP